MYTEHMMRNPRILFSVLLGVSVVLVSYYFSQAFFPNLGRSGIPASVAVVSSGNTPKFAEQGDFSAAAQKTNLTQQAITGIGTDFYTKTQNASDAERDDLYAQIKAGNIGGVTDPQKLAEQLTPDVIGIRTEVSEGEVQSDSSNDMHAYRQRYLLAVTDAQIFTSTYDPVEIMKAFLQGGDATGMDALVSASQNVYAALREIPVPDAAKKFHADNLLYFSNSAAVYAAIRQYQTDPLKGYFAIQQMPLLSSLWKEIYTSTVL
jgi:hypothetical protein